jgi:hypothetical protein
MKVDASRRLRGQLIARLCKLYGVAVAIIGVLIVIGTIGASDQMMLSSAEIARHIAFGGWLVGQGYFAVKAAQYVEAITW